MSGRLPPGVRANLSSDRLRILLTLGEKELGHLNVVPASEEHRNFILSTWVRSYQGEARKFMDRDIYAKEEAVCAEAYWKLSTVAVSPEDAYVIHGWACARPNRLYHAYVPPDLRRYGIASALVKSAVYEGAPVFVARPGFNPFGFKTRLNPYILRDS